MSPSPSSAITELLCAWSRGDQDAFDKVIQIVYPELRRIAQRYLSDERHDHTIQATALVHEAYIRLIDVARIEWRDRAHFFAVSAKIMRRILVDHARLRGYAKRGGGSHRVDFTEALAISSELDRELVQMDDALNDLATFDARKAQVVEMRYFGGLKATEIAAVLGISPQSVNRDWNLAKAWLAREMAHKDSSDRSTRRTFRS